MSTIHPSKLEGILQNKFGFEPVKARSDHRWYELKLPGLPAIRTKVSHSRDPVGPKLQGMIARQLRVTKPFFVDMISCQNSKADYERQVMDDPHPPFDILF